MYIIETHYLGVIQLFAVVEWKHLSLGNTRIREYSHAA